MLTLMAFLARKFNKRLVVAFAGGVLVGAVVLSLLLAVHLRQACSAVGVAGLVVCKVG